MVRVIWLRCLQTSTTVSSDDHADGRCFVPTPTNLARIAVTVRLDPETHGRLRRIAKFEHRSMAGDLEMLVARAIAARDEAERVIRVHVAPELAGLPMGQPDRRPGESDKSYARRKKALDMLFGQ
jgi:predicted transcriptional regulator